MNPFAVIPALYVLKDCSPSLFGILICVKVDLFFFQYRMERFYTGIVIGIPFPAEGESVPKARQKKLKLLDINSEQELAEPAIWNEFWTWLETLEPAGGSKLEKAVNYAFNHKETLMNYLLDGRCEISNNAAKRRAKTYVTGRKNFLFHDTADGATASAIVLSLIETAKANNLDIYHYLYTLLLYKPDYKNEPAGLKQLLPWSDFIKDRCTGIIDIEKVRPEERGNLNI